MSSQFTLTKHRLYVDCNFHNLVYHATACSPWQLLYLVSVLSYCRLKYETLWFNLWHPPPPNSFPVAASIFGTNYLPLQVACCILTPAFRCKWLYASSYCIAIFWDAYPQISVTEYIGHATIRITWLWYQHFNCRWSWRSIARQKSSPGASPINIARP